uniref:Secreted protein n=1 Tax=Desulfobacca acetoxidans TaxID=60893 RepID=A0A7C3UYS9_9BACT
MLRNFWLVIMVGLFLAGSLLWVAPSLAQTQGWTCPRGYAPGTGPGWRGGGPGYCGNFTAPANPQYGYGYGYGRQARNRARWNTPPAPANLNPQTQTPAPQSGN